MNILSLIALIYGILSKPKERWELFTFWKEKLTDWWPYLVTLQSRVDMSLVDLVLVVFFVALLCQLLYFHIKLQRKGITTYEFIVRDNKVTRKKQSTTRQRQNPKVIKDAGDEKPTNVQKSIGQTK
eukprot:CAMPEP_0172424038 /NCGR_PEP_ID=MMETSP1064-20121228/20642_1 /TAXON_ID=202472 /ORGANISM="Aulacoseira subarctica , Strain CCAP 1002/5" /LENGTH=125 /DNA_ID=CAMNT_0013165757 /DNA_START=36 /DNA_END=410 /DNA_ORIENTATION=+